MKRILPSDSENPDSPLQIFCPGCSSSHEIATWKFDGNYELPTISGEEVLDIEEGYHCHFEITNGDIHYFPDSTHELAGQTIQLPELYEAEPSSDEEII